MYLELIEENGKRCEESWRTEVVDAMDRKHLEEEEDLKIFIFKNI